jgi:hypothetical protein
MQRKVTPNGNLSDARAALHVASQFTLIVVPKKKIHSCAVVWRQCKRIGIAFC